MAAYGCNELLPILSSRPVADATPAAYGQGFT
jgi:hypothetical protein